MKRTYARILVGSLLLIACVVINGAPAYPSGIPDDVGLQITEEEKERNRESRIKSKTVWSYRVDSAGELGADIRTSYSRYDRNGNIVEQTTFNRDGSVLQTLTQTYDSEGFPLESSVRRLGEEGEYRTVYHYNTDRRIVESVSYKPDGSVLVRTQYEYDSGGQLAEAVASMPDNPLPFFYGWRIEYNGEGMPVETINYDANGEVRSQAFTTYDSTGIRVQEVTAVLDGRVASTTNNSYDSDGNLMEIVARNSEGIILSRTTYNYDANGRVIEATVENPTVNMKSRVTTTYDSLGNKVEENSYNKFDELVSRKTFEYEYYQMDPGPRPQRHE